MSQPSSTPLLNVQEKTFSSYNQAQGKHYAQYRYGYHPKVYQTILDHHKLTGGQFDTLLDIGCGPGTAAIVLAPSFLHAVGLDPSEGMIETARTTGAVTSISEPVRFERCTAEDLGKHLSPPVQNASVDLITAANSAHWFDMSSFWQSAARVLKPGGSVALWTTGDVRPHPSTPNADAIQEALERIYRQKLEPYYVPGNLLTRNRYIGLPLPWTLDQPVTEFDESSFFRKEWDPAEDFLLGQGETDMETFEKAVATSSPVARWRQAHPDDVGTERDIVRTMRRDIERLLHEAGVEKGKEKVRGAVYGVVLIVKKKP